MSRDLGKSVGPLPPTAMRSSRPGWRDPRLWIGLVLLTASVLVGARLLASADDTVAVWAMASATASGAEVSASDVVVRRVRFADGADAALYLSADEPLPEGAVLDRAVGAGELLPSAALTDAREAGLVRVPLQLEPTQVPGSVSVGAVVDVYLDDRGSGRGRDGRALSAVSVVEAPAFDESFAVSGMRQLVVAVPEDEVEEFEAVLAAMADPILRIHVR